MKMPHVDDHTLRSSCSPHHHHEDRPARHQPPYYYDKRVSDAEVSPHVDGQQPSTPNHWRQHAQELEDHHSMDSTNGSRRSTYHDANSHDPMNTPPASPHIPLRYDYSSVYPDTPPSYYMPPTRGIPPVTPYSQRGGYSYHHHHPSGRPPMMPRDMHYYRPYDLSRPPPYYHTPYPPLPHSMPPPKYDTSSPGGTMSYYHEEQYPNFLPPSASIATTASSASESIMSPRERGDDDYYYGGGEDGIAHSPEAVGEVSQVGQNDVLCGRGAPTNYHPGNEFFRMLVKEYQNTYLTSKRADKPFVASHIVEIIRCRGGRFLRRHKRNGVSWERGHFVWVEVEPQKAYEKACQALREGAPDIRRKLAESGSTCSDDNDEDDATTNEGSPSKPARDVSSAASKKQQAVERKQAEEKENERDVQTGADGSKKIASVASDDDRNDDLQNSQRS